MTPQKNHQNKINNAHDLFFRESMQDIEIASRLALLSFPSSIQNHLDWETLEIVKETWVDENLREHRSDVIYRAENVRDDQWVYFLFEHKSTSDKRVQVQLLRYIVEIWEQHEKQKWPGKLLPLVIPIVVCHCNGICKLDNSVKEMVAIIEGTNEMVPDFRFLKLDLLFFERAQIDDGPPFVTLQRTGKLKIFLLALKYSRSPEILNVLRQIIRISEEVQKIEKWKYDYFNVVLNYLSSVIEESLYEQFWRIVVKELSGGVEYMGTIADKIRREERERIERELKKEIEKKESELEKEKVELEKKETELEKEYELLHQIVRRMHKKGINPKSIQEITGFNNETIEKIVRSADA